jgi:hypothetical protein
LLNAVARDHPLADAAVLSSGGDIEMEMTVNRFQSAIRFARLANERG